MEEHKRVFVCIRDLVFYGSCIFVKELNFKTGTRYFTSGEIYAHTYSPTFISGKIRLLSDVGDYLLVDEDDFMELYINQLPDECFDKFEERLNRYRKRLYD